jgi:hypothetical protein
LALTAGVALAISLSACTSLVDVAFRVGTGPSRGSRNLAVSGFTDTIDAAGDDLAVLVGHTNVAGAARVTFLVDLGNFAYLYGVATLGLERLDAFVGLDAHVSPRYGSNNHG